MARIITLSIALFAFSLQSQGIAHESTAEKSVVYDDGVGAKIEFHLPCFGRQDGLLIHYSTFSIGAVKDEKILLNASLHGKRTEDGEFFFGSIIIPSSIVDSSEINLHGGPKNSTRGYSKKLKVSDFKKVTREKSWTP